MKTSECTVFGWVIHHLSADVGESFEIRNVREADTTRLSSQTIYTKGKIVGYYSDNPSQKALDRVPGFGTDNLPNPLPRLNLQMTVEEPAEWWCISAAFNSKLPIVSFLRMSPEETKTFPAGSKIFVCEGDVAVNGISKQAPLVINATNEVVLTASVNSVYALQFDRENATI